MADLEKQLRQAEDRALRAEKQLLAAERKLREFEQQAPALDVLKSLTDAARARADRLEAELRQTKAELHLAQSAPEFQRIVSSPAAPLYDEATGLPNGLLMERYVDYALQQARRYKRKTGLVVVRPRQSGPHDELIVRLKAAIRSSDVLGRHEGDFLLLLSEVKGKQDLAGVVRRLTRGLAVPLAGGQSLQLGLGAVLAPGEAKDAEDMLRLAGEQAEHPLALAPEPLHAPPESAPAPTPAPERARGDEPLPTYPPLSSSVIGRLGHPATVDHPLNHLQRSGLRSKEALRWLLEAAAWRLAFEDLEGSLEALTYLQRHPTGDPQENIQALALQALVTERAERTDEAQRLRTQLCSMPLRIPQSLLTRNFRVETPEPDPSATRYSERDQAVKERHERLAALLYMSIVLGVAHNQQPKLAAYFEENLERLRALARLLED